MPGHDPPSESWHEDASPPGILAKTVVRPPATLPEGRAVAIEVGQMCQNVCLLGSPTPLPQVDGLACIHNYDVSINLPGTY